MIHTRLTDVQDMEPGEQQRYIETQKARRDAMAQQVKTYTKPYIEKQDSSFPFRMVAFARPSLYEGLFTDGLAVTKRSSILLFSIVPEKRSQPTGSKVCIDWPSRLRQVDWTHDTYSLGVLDTDTKAHILTMWEQFVVDTVVNAASKEVLIPHLPDLSWLFGIDDWANFKPALF